MAHVMKYTKASCGHMFAHFDRKAEHISNENLDKERTHLNYNLATHQPMEQGEFVRRRCSEVRCQNRKDVNVMVSWVITAPRDLPESEHRAFFQASYDFLQQRYGRENVVSAYVHMDEVSPHMHYAFVPVVEDKKRGGYKLSAKETITREDLRTFHADLNAHMERELGHTVSILNEATKEGNRSIEELKRQSATDRLQEATSEASKILSKARQRATAIEDSVEMARAEYDALRALTGHKSADVYPEGVEIKTKGLFNKQEFVHIPKRLWEEKCQDTSKREVLSVMGQLEERIKAMRYSVSENRLDALERENTTLQKKIEGLEREIREVKDENYSLQQSLNQFQIREQQSDDLLDEVLSRLPPVLSTMFKNTWNSVLRMWEIQMENDLDDELDWDD